MPADTDQLQAARRLLAGAFHGVLSTQSLECPGYPFGSVTPYALDYAGLPILLLSHLAQHSRNLAADPRCGLTLLADDGGDVQQRARLSAIGAMEPAEPAEVAARYLRYYPHARPYFEALGFRFWRFCPLRLHWNGGFATARWFDAGRIVRPNPFPPGQETALLDHLNRDHGATLRRHLARAGVATAADGPPVITVGIDAAGIDLRQADRLYRLRLAREIADPGMAREILSEMARN